MIFLIGYRGTGKTTVARLLASRLGWDWRDADAVLEAEFGRPINDIFQTDGEAKFRELEAAVLAELCKLTRVVIATGGGVVLRDPNRELMRRTGRVVWLTADHDTIWSRIQADAAEGRPRPALTVGGRAEIEDLLHVREPLYQACAEFKIETGGRTPEEVADEIAARIRV
jgi:shikimate kinase